MSTPGTALRRIDVEQLTIRRQRKGSGFTYLRANGQPLRDERTLYRLKRLAVPPAYEDVLYAQDHRAHIQAIGRDAAGRRQYRYHPEWTEVRETRKAKRLAELVRDLPQIRRAVSRHMRGSEPTRELALAAVIDLISCTAFRPGSETYARERGTRGAATLLKSNVTVSGDRIALNFRGKGGKQVEKEFRAPRLARAVRLLMALPGKRLFQYRAANGTIGKVRRRDVNVFLRAMTPEKISLKDFRTMIACSCALEHLADLEPKTSERGRRKQVTEALRAVADELVNTPAICGKSYVHTAVVQAFESGALKRMAKRAGSRRSASQRTQMLANVLNAAAI